MTLILWEGSKYLTSKNTRVLCARAISSALALCSFNSAGKCVCLPEHHVSLCLALVVDAISVDELESPITHDLSEVILLMDLGSMFLPQRPLSVDMPRWGLGMSHM